MEKKEYSAEYKAKIVMEILEGANTLAEIAGMEGISSRTLAYWKQEFKENAARAFSISKDEREARKAQQEAEEREKRLAEKVGQLTMENDWLKKKSEEIGFSREKKHVRR